MSLVPLNNVALCFAVVDEADLYVVEGGHCSCNGLEGQFEPSRTYARIEQKRFEKADRAPFSAGDETSRVSAETAAGIKRFQTLINRLAAKENLPNA